MNATRPQRTIAPRSAAIAALLATALMGMPARSTSAADIEIRLSIKYILDGSGNRAPGFYSEEDSIRWVIDATNRALARWDRGYRYVIDGNIEEISETTTPGSSLYFNVNGGAGTPSSNDLEDAAIANPVGYRWRTDAVNVYIVNCCAAGAAIPSQDLWRRLVFFSAGANFSSTDPGQNARQTLWGHELGHHFALIHPWVNDGVADTRQEPTPEQCTGTPPPTSPFPCSNGGAAECCCSTKHDNLVAAAQTQGWSQQEFDDLRFNLMGYFGAVDCFAMGEAVITIDNMRLTEGQLDRWTDATRLYHFNDTTRVGEVSGLTYFVDGGNVSAPFTGYSADPYRTVTDGVAAAFAGGGDIVLIRTGNYPETPTWNKPVTLRANRGVVRIGP